jgi:DNA-binding CsgD family transcriptional regulator
MRANPAYDQDDPPDTGTCSQTDELARLAHELMRRVHDKVPAAGNDVSQVLMDIEADGIRCVLLRLAVPRRTPLLSPRELEIARMIARGLPNKTIAAVLEISSWTVGTYLRRMFAKLQVSSRAALVAKVAQDARERIGDRDENSHSRT